MAGDGLPGHGALFLDRDGVINRKPAEGAYVRTWAEFELLPGTVRALSRVQAAGATPFVITNQRGVARGFMSGADLDVLHRRLTEELGADGVQLGGIYACPHDVGVCDCRKPQVGLFRQAQREHPWIDFAAADLVGDSLGDLEAGHRLKIRVWLVGEEPRRREIARAAGKQGIPLAGEAGSLLALVEDGRLLQSIGRSNA